MNAPETACPRCAQALKPTSTRGVSLETCPSCSGSLLANPDLARLLEALSVDLLKTFNPDANISPCSSGAGPLTCPRCAVPFDQGDYCQAGLVIFDRCDRCNVLWLEPGELGTMTLMWARMDARLNRTQQENRAWLADAQEFVDGVRLARAVSNLLI